MSFQTHNKPRETTPRGPVLKRALTLLRTGLTLLAIAWITSYFFEHRTEILQATSKFDAGILLAAMGVVLVGLLPGAWAWQRVLTLTLPEVTSPRGILVYLCSSIGKYTPGGALAFAIQHRFLRDDGARPMLLLQVFVGTAMAACLAAALLGLPAIFAFVGIEMNLLWMSAGLGLAALILALVSAMNRWPLFPVTIARIGIPAPAPFIQTVLLMIGAWALTGTHLVVLGTGLDASALFLISAYAFSAIAGIVFAILPGAFGVRDGVLLMILAARLDPADAIILSLLSRVLIITGDVIGSALARLALHWSHPKPQIERTFS